MSSDPAVNAAARAFTALEGDSLMVAPKNVRECSVAAARAALESLRDLHKASKWEWCGEVMVSCFECGRSWPCDTAKLIYPAEELR